MKSSISQVKQTILENLQVSFHMNRSLDTHTDVDVVNCISSGRNNIDVSSATVSVGIKKPIHMKRDLQ